MPDQDDSDKKGEANNPPDFGRSTRRTFLGRLGTAGLLATAARLPRRSGNFP
jgi:hypothetical protein